MVLLTMFAKSKCLLVLNRANRLVQSPSIRKSNHIKYSSASIDGGSSQLQVKRNRSRSSHNIESEVCTHEAELLEEKVLPDSYELRSIEKITHENRITDKSKGKINEVIKQAEEFLQCRLHRSRSSPIGVGVPTLEKDHQPYFNLLPSWFERDSSQIASRIPALLGSGHPILRLKQTLDPDADEHFSTLLGNNIQWRAFIILLVTKAFGHSTNLQQNRKLVETVNAKQRPRSEIAEMMDIAFSLHGTIVEIQHSQTSDVAMEEKESSLHLGNKIAVLFGDLLLARTSKGLSSLENARVTELMSDAISDFSESEILRRRQLDVFKPVVNGSSEVFKEFAGRRKTTEPRLSPTYELWRSRVNLDIASLIGRSCLCSTIFSQLDEGASNLAFKIGSQIGLVLQAYKDFELYSVGRSRIQPTFDLCALPVVFHLNSDDSVDRLYNHVDIHKLYRDVATSPEALLQTRKALENLKEDALRIIAQLPRSTPAPQMLEEFITTLS